MREPDGDEFADEFDPWDDVDPDDDSCSIPCPECRRDIYDDVAVCPHCGLAILTDTSPWAGRPIVWVVLGLTGIVATIYAMARFNG